jgi:hypothetical protein
VALTLAVMPHKIKCASNQQYLFKTSNSSLKKSKIDNQHLILVIALEPQQSGSNTIYKQSHKIRDS